MDFTSTTQFAGGSALVLKENKNSEETEIPSCRLEPSVETNVIFS